MTADDRRNPRRAFYDAHLPFVLEVARPMLRDEDEVREVVSSVFTDVLSRWDARQEMRDPRQWFREVTRNHCRRRWRERYRQTGLFARALDVVRETVGLHERAEAEIPPEDGPDRSHDRRHMRAAFLRAFYALDEDEQAVIQLRHLDPELTVGAHDEEPTLDEMATALGWPKIRVRRRLESARMKLARSLTDWLTPARALSEED